jgi:thiol-disulfide isomerase/thioredoxin
MIVLHIDNNKDVSQVDKLVKQGKHVFILVYMEGCGPCNATRPEWSKLESALKQQYSKNDKLVIIDINKDYLSGIKSIGSIDGFPTLKYIGNNGKSVETYENSSVKKKDRSVDSFINWIEYKINDMRSTTKTSSAQDVYNRISNKLTKKAHVKHKKRVRSRSHNRSRSRSRSRNRKG